MGLELNEVHDTIENLKEWGYSIDQAIELLKVRELNIAADALESISSTLESIDQSLDLMSDVLADAQVKTQYGSAIAVTGAIQQI